MKNILLDRVNGYYDHVHCLLSIDKTQSLDKVVQLLKGESSFWFNNKSGFKTHHLTWQNDYFAVSVGERQIHRIRAYIDGQVSHHAKRTFHEEYEELRNEYGFDISDFN